MVMSVTFRILFGIDLGQPILFYLNPRYLGHKIKVVDRGRGSEVLFGHGACGPMLLDRLNSGT